MEFIIMRKLELIIPGLLWQNLEEYTTISSGLRIPILTHLCNKGTINLTKYLPSDYKYQLNQQHSSYAAALAQQHQISGFKHYLIASPTHLTVGATGLTICQSELLALTDNESREFINSINCHFTELKLFKLNQTEWLLGINDAIANINFYPLYDIVGEDIRPLLAQTKYSLKLNQIFNEMQMLLNNHKINIIRETNDLLSLNSLWLWDKTNFQISAMAFDFKNEFEFNSLLSTNKKLLIDNLYYPCKYNDYFNYKEQIEQLELKLIQPLYKLLKNGTIGALNIHALNRKLSININITRLDLLKFWRQQQITHLVKRQNENSA